MPFLTSLETKKTQGKKEYTLLAPLVWTHHKLGKVVAHKDFVTDLASVPPVCYSLVPEIVDNGEPAVIHDLIYKYPTRFTRAQADRVFYLGMRDVGVNWVQAQMGWAAVRFLGGEAWDSYRAQEQGLIEDPAEQNKENSSDYDNINRA